MLGTTFTHLTDCALWCTRAEAVWGVHGQQRHVVEIVRNRYGPSGDWLVYDLVRNGYDIARTGILLTGATEQRNNVDLQLLQEV
jgi:hypothetical protein